MKIETKLSGHAYDLVQNSMNENKGNYFEIGVFYGSGFHSMAAHYADRKCYAVDPFIEDGYTVDHSKVGAGSSMNPQKESALAYVAEVDNAELFIMTSHDFKAQLTSKQIDDMEICTVLIDGNHHYNFVVNDYQLALQLVGNRSASIIFDDVDKPGVYRAYKEFCDLNQDRIIDTDNKFGEAIQVRLKAIDE